MLARLPMFGPLGCAEEGEIEILTDPEQIALASKTAEREIGVLQQDRYWIWLNDPVKFPSGKLGVYGRILAKSALNGCGGSAVIPLLADGRIALNCNYRHATRSWELEIPRGIAKTGESPEGCASRELLEETGLVAHQFVSLGVMPPDSGVSNMLASIFLGRVETQVPTQQDDSEAIDSIVFLTMSELRDGLVRGFLSLEIRGKTKKVYLRDPFLTFGLLQMELRGFKTFREDIL